MARYVCFVFCLFSLIVLATATVNPESWMGDLKNFLSNRTLIQVTLPGTHDSGAYMLTRYLQPGYISDQLETLIRIAERLGLPIEKVITPWALAQDDSFYAQLKGGVRYLDVRAGWNGTYWNTFHFEIGNTIETLLSDVRKFLDEQKDEIVVVEVSHIGDANPSDDAYKELIQIIESQLGPYLYPRSDAFKSTIGQMISRGQRALVSFENDSYVDSNPNLWYGSTMLNTYANSDDLQTMVTYNNKQLTTFNSGQFPGQLYKISWTLTPQTSTIEHGIIGSPKSLEELAAKANGALPDFVASANKQKLCLGNLFLIDFFDKSQVIQLINAAALCR